MSSIPSKHLEVPFLRCWLDIVDNERTLNPGNKWLREKKKKRRKYGRRNAIENILYPGSSPRFDDDKRNYPLFNSRRSPDFTQVRFYISRSLLSFRITVSILLYSHRMYLPLICIDLHTALPCLRSAFEWQNRKSYEGYSRTSSDWPILNSRPQK